MKTFSAIWTDKLKAAIIEALPDFYDMKLNRSDSELIREYVNVGIDSHLEACFVIDRGDKYSYYDGKLHCKISKQSMPVLIRRLMECEDERGLEFASSICSTIGIELI